MGSHLRKKSLSNYPTMPHQLPDSNSQKQFRRGVSAGLLAGALWGLVFLYPRVTPEFSPMSQMVLRYICYGLFAAVLSMRALRLVWSRLTRDDWRMLVKISLQANIFYYVCLATGVKYGGIAPTTLIIGMLPVTIALVGAQHDHASLGWRKLLAPMALMVLGIVTISYDLFAHANENLSSTPSQRAFALLAAFGALVLWTLAAVNNARYLRSHNAIEPKTWSDLCGVTTAVLAVLMLGVGLVVAQFAPSSIFAINTDANLPWLKFLLIGGVVIAFLASWLGNILWNVASHLLPISLSGQMLMSETLFSLIYGFMYDGRMPRSLEWLAMGLALSGVIWAVRLHSVVRADEVPTH
jgi:drug/metabolite transporter (DMT)-like permease